MIAAAMLGRSVEWASSSTDKVRAIAESALCAHSVRPIPLPARSNGAASNGTSRPRAPAVEARVTAVILCHDRPEQLGQAVRSVTASEVPARVLVIDNNSGPEARAAATQLADADPRVEVRRSDRNLGCAGGRRMGSDLVETEYTLFLDDDAELRPGALEALVEDLDAHPEAAAVTALVLQGNGRRVYHFGGWIEEDAEVVRFTLDGGHMAADDPSLPGTGPSGWVPGTAALIRTELLRCHPIDLGMRAYYEDNEWGYRVALERPDAFRRCREAVAVHYGTAPTFGPLFHRRSVAVERLSAFAYFLERHGRLMEGDLGGWAPELLRPDGSLDLDATRLLLELVTAKGTDWVFAEWYAGRLAALLERPALNERVADAEAARDAAALQASGAEARADEATRREADAAAQAREATEQAAATHATMERLAADVTHLNDVLHGIQEGGWWRLRARLLPAIRLVGALRRKARR